MNCQQSLPGDQTEISKLSPLKAVEVQKDVLSGPAIDHVEDTTEHSLQFLLTIWPVTESLATNLPVGDLITLARTSAGLRASLHGGVPTPRSISSIGNGGDTLQPQPGSHQSPQWARLKNLSPFECSSRTHTRGGRPRPCVYCSRPICEACIVRDSFKHRHENTFGKRLRYLCKVCWTKGGPTKAVRYSIDPAAVITHQTYSTEDDTINDLDHRIDLCCCTLKKSGWLCLECKEAQNTSNAVMGAGRAELANIQDADVECYGLTCTNRIDAGNPDKDRRRVCTWCHKATARQFAGEERLAWQLKTNEIRAINAESRSRDVQEYNRQRWEQLRMSRNQLRNANGGPRDERPEFVRHLDTINYRSYVEDSRCPTPEDVYNSKRGYWRYKRGFLLRIRQQLEGRAPTLSSEDASELERITKNGVSFARTNAELERALDGLITDSDDSEDGENAPNSRKAMWTLYRTQILIQWYDLLHTEELDLKSDPDQAYGHLCSILNLRYKFTTDVVEVKKYITSSLDEGDSTQKSPSKNDTRMTYGIRHHRRVANDTLKERSEKYPAVDGIDGDDEHDDEVEDKNENKHDDDEDVSKAEKGAKGDKDHSDDDNTNDDKTEEEEEEDKEEREEVEATDQGRSRNNFLLRPPPPPTPPEPANAEFFQVHDSAVQLHHQTRRQPHHPLVPDNPPPYIP